MKQLVKHKSTDREPYINWHWTVAKCGERIDYDVYYRTSYAWKNVTCKKCLKDRKR